MPVELWETSPLGGGLHAKRGVLLTAELLHFLQRVRRHLRFDLVVTSGRRESTDQAAALAAKVRAGANQEDLRDLYVRDDLVDEIYRDADPLTEETIKAVIERQVARGDLLSSHLAGALDLRLWGYTATELQELVRAVAAEAGRVVAEVGAPGQLDPGLVDALEAAGAHVHEGPGVPHLHIELGPSDRRALQDPPVSEPTTHVLPERLREELAPVAGDAVERLVHVGFTRADAEEFVIDLLDAIIALPEPAESMSDVAIEAAVPKVFEALRRNPPAMRERARVLRLAGKGKRAARLRDRADRVEARQG